MNVEFPHDPLRDMDSRVRAERQLQFEGAVTRGQEQEVRRLLQEADPEQGLAWTLQLAAWEGDAVRVARFLQGSPIPPCHRALMMAARRNQAPVLRLLLPHGDPCFSDSLSLRLAAEAGHLAAVDVLLPFSDPKAHDSHALRLAARAGHTEVVRRLLPWSDPGARNSEALAWVALNGPRELVALLAPLSDPRQAWVQLVESSCWTGLDSLAPLVSPGLWRAALEQAPRRILADREGTLARLQGRLAAHDLATSLGAATGSGADGCGRTRL